MIKHTNFSNPHSCEHTRILWLLPVYFLFSWVGIAFQEIHARLVISVLMDLVFPGQKHVVKQPSVEMELMHLLYVVSEV